MTTNTHINEMTFVINKQLQGLSSYTSNIDEGAVGQSNVTMQAIVYAAIHPTEKSSQQTLKVINTSIKYFALYKQVLVSISSFQSYKQASASSITGNKKINLVRKGEGFTLKVVEETSSEVYVIVKLDDGGSQSKVVLHCELNKQIHIIALPYVNNNKYQTIISTQDEAFSTIVNDESHLYLT